MTTRSKLGARIPVLNDCIRRNGRAPTLEELCALFKVRSKNTASFMAKGFVCTREALRTVNWRALVPGVILCLVISFADLLAVWRFVHENGST